MLGCFQYFFIEKGLFQESFLTIWIHGTLEISAIVIAGAAGLTMGRGLIFPGTYTRLQAFQRSARRGVKIMIGTVPLFIVAGFLEGYLTRHTETPDLIRAIFIFACLFFVIAYFVIYPRYKARIGFNKPLDDTKILPDNTKEMDYGQIKSSGQLFSDMFVLVKRHASQLALYALFTSVTYCVLVFLLVGGSPTDLFTYSSGVAGGGLLIDQIFDSIATIDMYFANENINTTILSVVNVLVLSILSFLVGRLLIKGMQDPEKETPGLTFALALQVFVGMTVLQLLFITNFYLTFLLLILLLPVPLMTVYMMLYEKLNLVKGTGRSLDLIRRNFGRVLGLFVVILFLGLSLYALTDTILADFFLDLVGWIIYLPQEQMNELSVVLFTFIKMFTLHLVFILIFISLALLCHTLIEIKDANRLRQRIQTIGTSKRIRGLEQEA